MHFGWYEKGVESHLRITNLYEYYMASTDMDSVTELPKVILMYFSFQNNLDYEHSAIFICVSVETQGGIRRIV